MEKFVYFLIALSIISLTIAYFTNLKAKKLQLKIAKHFDGLRFMDDSIKLSKRNSMILYQIVEFKQAKENLESKINNSEKRINELENAIRQKDQLFQGLKDKSNESISRITSLYTDFLFVEFEISAQHLETKTRPAIVEAQRIRELKTKSKFHKVQYRQMMYKYEELLQLFPELENYVDDFSTIQQLDETKTLEKLQKDFDRVKYYMSKDEYEHLSLNERNQLALNRYLKGMKSNWQIGRDYELYCGYQYEKNGWSVDYIGMEQKLNDLGRDLIVRKENEIHIVQCKYWSKKKVIHEKHITQLYGTTIAYGLDKDKSLDIIPVFITNIELSETAQKFANKLGVQIIQKDLEEFPRIKCNINKDEFGLETRIYHLPFDQQYDRTQIKKKGEFYSMTVKEAVDKGFRRAYKYYGG